MPYSLRCLLLCSLVIIAGGKADCQTFVFAQLTGSPMNTTGWNLTGNAQVADVIGTGYTELLLTRPVTSQAGGIFFAQPINLAFCNKWIAQFDFRMYDGTGADGIAFCFLDVPPSNYVVGGGLGIPDVANGLKVCFDTWNNCVNPGAYDSITVHQDMPKIEIRWGTGYDQTSQGQTVVGECLNQPTLANTNGGLSFIRGPNYNTAKIVYDTGRISVYVNDSLYLSTYQPNQFNFSGYMGFTAGTGGFYDNQSIKNVIIYTQMPVPYAGPPQTFCPYDTVQLGGPVNPAYVYAWSPPTGLSDTISSGPLLHLSNTTGDSAIFTYYVKTAYADNPGCSSLDSVRVKVYPNPVVNFLLPKICATDINGQFYDSSWSKDAETLPFTYIWSFGDPGANSTLQNPVHSYGGEGNYTTTLRVTNSEGCVDSASKILTVNGTDPEAAFQVIDPGGLCSNTAVQLSNGSFVNYGSIVAVQIYWGDTVGVSYMDSMPYPGKVYSHHYPNPVSSAVATYTIRMIAASGRTCENETDQVVTINPSPHAEFGVLPALCEVDTAVSLSTGSELTGLGGSFLYGGRGVSDGAVLNPLRAGPGEDTLFFAYRAADGCSDTAYQGVYIQALPVVRTGDDTAVVIGQPLQLNAWSSDRTGDVFLWTPPEGLNDAGIADPLAILGPGVDSIRYRVTATDSLGCYGQASVNVKVFRTGPDLFVPNGFTPGGGSNRVFRPVPVGIAQLLYFKVYNRLGQLVYSTSRIGEGWDGTVDGKRQSTGVFVWVAEATTYTGKVIARKGTVVLVR